MISNTIESKNTELLKYYNGKIRKYSYASNGYYLLRIDSSIKWFEFTDFIYKNIGESKDNNYERPELLTLIKCLVLERIFDLSDHELPLEISKNKVYMKFLVIESEEKIPLIKTIASFHRIINEAGLYDFVIEKFYKQLLENNSEIAEDSDPESKSDKTEIVPVKPEESEKTNLDDKLYVQMHDLFFRTLDVSSGDDLLSDKEIRANQLMKKLQYVDEIIMELKKKVNMTNDINGNLNPDAAGSKSEMQIEEPIELHPEFKKEGIFNDENLTEDYELGYRYYQLGLKMGFFNVKLDNNNESSRISTAEFFPNTFWGSVKQRSRWIAGICLQNWKAHKWRGNLTMKYFLFRDRKPLFSLLGAFLSNAILFYLIYAVVTNLLFGGNAVFLVSNSPVLWYIMAANVIFMVSRASHRFIFTYNWYGFKYAFYSFFRLILDTAINFFAVLRSLSVYKKIKQKVVWDSTSHY
jgi:hypothetical protein